MAAPDLDPIPETLIDSVCQGLAADKSVRQVLPGGGSLNIDRLLPSLCVYRRDPSRADEGTGRFVTPEAAYLMAPGEAVRRKGLQRLVRRIVETVSARLGGFLILEVWSADNRMVPRDTDPITGEVRLPGPGFRVLTRFPQQPEGTAASLASELQRIKVQGQPARVEINLRSRNHPPRMTQLISTSEAERMNCHVLGLEILPIYRHRESGEVYDDILRRLRQKVARALKRAFFTFALEHTQVRPQHYWVLGRKTLSRTVWTVDRQLADVGGQFKFLLLVTPVNAEREWHSFVDSKFSRPPRFQYRPWGTDPLVLKRRLLNIQTEQIDDPTLSYLFRQTQDELERQITMLSDIGTDRFLPGSLQVFGAVTPALLTLANDVLARCPEPDRGTDMIPARTFAERARREIRQYRRQMPSFAARVIVRDDMYSGLLSSGGNLLVGRETLIAAHRVEALLHHEVGTHLVTYFNGQAQPLRLLQVGLAGYDALQEGLAVLSEYLVGGLSLGRLRTLAARVVAVDRMIRGAPFVDTFQLLVDGLGFEPRVAHTILVRVYRGGGLTKDAVYLRGLVEVLRYLGRHGELEALFAGKFASDHIPIVRELLFRGVLRQPQVRPRFLDAEGATERLAGLRQGRGVLDLLER